MIRVRVFGPAYLDRVIRVDRPLLDRGTLDGSYEGRIEPGDGPWRLCDEAGGSIEIRRKTPGLGSDPMGNVVRIAGRLRPSGGSWTRPVSETSESCDLGGMGAGFAVALGGELVSAIGDDARGAWVAGRLAGQGIAHRPILVSGRETDWTLIVSSGPFGDKLAVGFRGCHAAVRSLGTTDLTRPCELLVVAGLPNPLVQEALAVPARFRFFAPAMRNMTDRLAPLASLAGRFDVLSCNRREWKALDGGDRVLRETPLVAVTDGPDGCVLNFRDGGGVPSSIALPAFPRDDPPRDTNRAGEAFASTLIATLIEAGWTPGAVDADLVRRAGVRASAASALVLDREDFGFPNSEEIDQAVRAGRVAGGGGRPPG